jgi:hypothetical protein
MLSLRPFASFGLVVLGAGIGAALVAPPVPDTRARDVRPTMALETRTATPPAPAVPATVEPATVEPVMADVAPEVVAPYVPLQVAPETQAPNVVRARAEVEDKPTRRTTPSSAPSLEFTPTGSDVPAVAPGERVPLSRLLPSSMEKLGSMVREKTETDDDSDTTPRPVRTQMTTTATPLRDLGHHFD